MPNGYSKAVRMYSKMAKVVLPEAKIGRLRCNARFLQATTLSLNAEAFILRGVR